MVVLSFVWYRVSRSPTLLTGILPVGSVEASAPIIFLRLRNASGLVDFTESGVVIVRSHPILLWEPMSRAPGL